MANHSHRIVATLAFTWMTAAGAAASAADLALNCQASKLKLAGKYASCLLGAEAKGAQGGDPVVTTKCDDGFASKWQDAEEKAGPGICPTDGDQVAIGSYVNECADSVAAALNGSSLPACAYPATPLKSGQRNCYNATQMPASCENTGQDGDLRRGLVRRFVDEGDGTITDKVTGLMWEKLADDGSIHRKDDEYYTLAQALTLKIASLNSQAFAGHNDWRLPNVKELQTLADFGESNGVHAAFNQNCSACTILDCSCTGPGAYWSSTADASATDFVWVVQSASMHSNYRNENSPIARAHVRAVRGG